MTAAVNAGIAAVPDGLIDHGVIPKIHPAVFKALGQAVELHVSLTETQRETYPRHWGSWKPSPQ